MHDLVITVSDLINLLSHPQLIYAGKFIRTIILVAI